MTHAATDGGPPPCIRDLDGFCALAIWGNPKCFSGPDGVRCDETDADVAYMRLIGMAKARLRADPAEVERILR